MSAPTDIRWKVAPVPTGRYRSFDRRAWPHAETRAGQYLGDITCDDEYRPARARGEQPHAELRVYVCDYREANAGQRNGWEKRLLKKRCASLDEAKATLASFFAANPDWFPKSEVAG